MAGLDPAIGYPHQIANDAIPVSNHPMEMAGSSPAMTWLDRCVWYNNQGSWYYVSRLPSERLNGVKPQASKKLRADPFAAQVSKAIFVMPPISASASTCLNNAEAMP